MDLDDPPPSPCKRRRIAANDGTPPPLPRRPPHSSQPTPKQPPRRCNAAAPPAKRDHGGGAKTVRRPLGFRCAAVSAALLRVARLPRDDPDRQHFSRCNKPRAQCGWCTWAANKTKWCKEFLIAKENQTWIMSGYSSCKELRLGCMLCKSAKFKSVFGMMSVPTVGLLQKAVFTQHARSGAHQRAELLWQGLDPDGGGIGAGVAPPLAQFEKVLALTKQGKASGDMMPGVGSRKRVRKIKWCLAEARREHRRSQMKAATCIALHQDARKGQLALRFTACGKDLTPMVGVLGCASMTQTIGSVDAAAISKCTKDVVERLCTPMKNPPYCREPPKATLDTGLCDHIRATTELFDSDAAADETLAGKLLRGARPDNDGGRGDAFFPNIRVQNLDKAHASRRTLLLRSCNTGDILVVVLVVVAVMTHEMWCCHDVVRIILQSQAQGAMVLMTS